MNSRILKYNISEGFNVVRWCLISVVVAFVSVVSVYKYIDISDAASITFSSLETVYLILNDSINISYIFFPLYLFAICGIMFDDNFGSIEIIKSGSRGKWIFNKYVTFLFYTIIFFAVIFIMNYAISSKVFPYSAKWSQDFVKTQVSMGQNVNNFVYSPAMTIGISMAYNFFLYLFAGTVSMFISIKTDKEPLALIFSMISGIGVGLFLKYAFQYTAQNNVATFALQNLILIIGILSVFWIALRTVRKKDFNLDKRS